MRKRSKVVKCEVMPRQETPRVYPKPPFKLLSVTAQKVLRHLWAAKGAEVTMTELAKACNTKSKNATLVPILLNLSERGLIDVLNGDQFRAREAA